MFNEVVKYLQENDDERRTISERTEVMGKLCVDLKIAYSKVWMKQKLLDRFEDDIMIGNINGKEDVVTFFFNAKKILAEIYDTIDSSSENIEGQKQRIIETAAKFIKNDVKLLPSSKIYPSMNEFQSIGNCIEYLTPSIKSLLKTMFVSNDKDNRVAFIGQAIMQQIPPRALLVPLQVAVSVSLHHQFASRFIIDFLNAMGFGSSFSEMTKFEQNAAVSSKDTGIFEKFNPTSFIQFVADNVDHNIRTLDGLDTFHGMGIIAVLTPRTNLVPSVEYARCVVPQLNVTTNDILEIGKMERHFFSTRDRVCNQLKFIGIRRMVSCDPTKILGDLWLCAWLLKPHKPMWNVYMQMIHHSGSHPGKSTIINMPMTDMKSSDPSCILSTLTFISKQAEQIGQSAVVTFDQPLYWKAMEIQMWEQNEPPLKKLCLS